MNVEASKADENGQAIHEECYVEKIEREQQAFKQAFEDLFKAPFRVCPSK